MTAEGCGDREGAGEVLREVVGRDEGEEGQAVAGEVGAERHEVAPGFDDDQDAGVRERDDHALQQLTESDHEQRADGQYREFAEGREAAPGRSGPGCGEGRRRPASGQPDEQHPCRQGGRQHRDEGQAAGPYQGQAPANVGGDAGEVGQHDVPAQSVVQQRDDGDEDVEQYDADQLLGTDPDRCGEQHEGDRQREAVDQRP